MNGTITRPKIAAEPVEPAIPVIEGVRRDAPPRFIVEFRRVQYSAFSNESYVQAALFDRRYDRIVFRSGEYGSVSAATDAVLVFTGLYCPHSDVVVYPECPARPIRLG